MGPKKNAQTFFVAGLTDQYNFIARHWSGQVTQAVQRNGKML